MFLHTSKNHLENMTILAVVSSIHAFNTIKYPNPTKMAVKCSVFLFLRSKFLCATWMYEGDNAPWSRILANGRQEKRKKTVAVGRDNKQVFLLCTEK